MAYCAIKDVEAIEAGRLQGSIYSDYTISPSTLTISNANPGVVTYTANTLHNGQAVIFTAVGAGTLPAQIVAGTKYYVGNNTGNAFNLYNTQANALNGGSTGVINTTGSAGTVYLISPATVPSYTQILSYINSISDEIDATILRAGYQVPVTTNNYTLNCNAMGAAWMVEIAINVSGNPEIMKVAEQRMLSYQKMLKNIQDNPRLSGAFPAQGTQNNLASSDGVTNWVNPNAEFQTNSRNW